MAGAARPAGATPSRSASTTARGSTSGRTRRRSPSGTGPSITSSSSSPNAVDLVERLVWHHDQPFGDSSAVPTFLLSEVTRGDVTVALSGDGGDELFAGYERFAAGLAARRYRRRCRRRFSARRSGARSALLPATALRGRAGSVQRFAGVAERGLPGAYRAWISYDPGRRAQGPARRGPRRLGARRTTARSGLVTRAPTRSTGCWTSTCAPTCSTTCS